MTVTVEIAREFLEYDRESGLLYWKPRQPQHFATENAFKTWNAKWANKPAFTATDGKGYKCGAVFYRLYRAHRVCWLIHHGEWPDHIDHVDGDTTNNRISNLRSVSISGNLKNAKRRTDNKSGHPGIYWASRDKRWVARITSEGEVFALGHFHTIEAAIEARQMAQARLGFHANHGRPEKCLSK
jgi:hypothetical protein